MALDHLVQPLTVLCLELLLVLLASLLWWWVRGSAIGAAAAIISAAGVGLMATSLMVAWGAHMRHEIPPTALLGLPRYLLSRARNQIGWLIRPQQDWVRTPRPDDAAGAAPASPANGSAETGGKGTTAQAHSDLAAARS